MNISDIILDKTKTVAPNLHPVPKGSISKLSSELPVSEELKEIWSLCGYGSFNRSRSGDRLTEAYNRLLHPEQISDIKGELPDYEVDPFIHGVPFFNIVDQEYLIILPSGEVAYVAADTSVRTITPSLGDFFKMLMDDPAFYEAALGSYSP